MQVQQGSARRRQILVGGLVEAHAPCFAREALVDLPSWRLAPKLMQHRPKQLLPGDLGEGLRRNFERFVRIHHNVTCTRPGRVSARGRKPKLASHRNHALALGSVALATMQKLSIWVKMILSSP